MTSKKPCPLGIMLRREHPPEAIFEFSRRAENFGFDEVWVVEDTFYASGVASAATALANTKSITVGLGIMPAVVRNSVFTAMEIATIARMFPGRFLPGIGHGSSHWMESIGAMPKSQLTALREVVQTVKALLNSETCTKAGQYVQLNEGKLHHPPEIVPPISLGVVNRKSLAISGEFADGTILGEYSNPGYVAWAKEIISSVKTDVSEPHRITVFMFASAEDSLTKSCAELRPLVTSAINSRKIDAKLQAFGILEEIARKRISGDIPESWVPDEWISQLAIAGTPSDWLIAIQNLVNAGANTVVVVPLPGKPLSEIDRFAKHLDL